MALTAVGTVFPIVSGHHVWTGTDLIAVVLAQLTAVCAGTAIGLVCSRLVVPRPGYSLLLALLVVIALPIVPGLPPINPMLTLLQRESPPPGRLGSLTGYLGIAVLLLAACTAATRSVAVRRS